MKIFKDFKSDYYKNENIKLANCITIDADKSYYYEFTINNNEALVRSNDFNYINKAIIYFRKYNMYVTKFYNADHSIYVSFDEIFTFKLPINIIQPSKLFLNQEILANTSLIPLNEIFLPVAIINDEYVLLDGHHRLYNALLNDEKMVNVYIMDYSNYISDFTYLAKENHIKKINDLQILSNEDYKLNWNAFIEQYFSVN